MSFRTESISPKHYDISSSCPSPHPSPYVLLTFMPGKNVDGLPGNRPLHYNATSQTQHLLKPLAHPLPRRVSSHASKVIRYQENRGVRARLSYCEIGGVMGLAYLLKSSHSARTGLVILQEAFEQELDTPRKGFRNVLSRCPTRALCRNLPYGAQTGGRFVSQQT